MHTAIEVMPKMFGGDAELGGHRLADRRQTDPRARQVDIAVARAAGSLGSKTLLDPGDVLAAAHGVAACAHGFAERPVVFEQAGFDVGPVVPSRGGSLAVEAA